MPLKILFGPKMLNYALALRLFVFSECGLKLTDKLVSIRHSGYPKFNRLLNKFGILRWSNISIFDPVESILENLKTLKPDVIATYPSMLLLLSNEIEKSKIVDINPRLILTFGETLTDHYRRRIRKIFDCDVFGLYASEEFARLAFECNKHSGYHVISDAAIIECVNSNQNVTEGEAGEIVVTSLFNYTMPLIRYRLGDIATFTTEMCTCGRGLPLIKNIEGRNDDFLTLPSGRKISPRMINVIENIPGVSMYRTIQITKNKFLVNLVKNLEFKEKTISEIKKQIKAGCLGEDVEIEVKVVEEIKREKGGKLRAVVSRVKE
jgi:phenylacetate-CoA ligase